MAATTKLLANTLKKTLSEPVEGFTVELEDESNLYEWTIYIEGPKDTPYEGGIFKLSMKFPPEYPMLPPELKFISDFWHPNVYKETGVVCISILHPPGEDEMSGELAAERWLPTQTVSTILLSVISLLSAPNLSSPANVDAGVEWRKDYEGFKVKCQKLAQKAKSQVPSHISIPHPDTNQEEREAQIAKIKEMNKPMDMDDFMNDDDDVQQGSDDGEEESESPEWEDSSEESEKAKPPPKKQTKPQKPTKETKNSPSKASKSPSKSKDNSKEKTQKTSARQVDEGGPVNPPTRHKKKKCIIM